MIKKAKNTKPHEKDETPKVTLSQLRAAMDVLKALGVQEFGETDGEDVYTLETLKLETQEQIDEYNRILAGETEETVQIPERLLESLLRNCRDLRHEWSWKRRNSSAVIRLENEIKECERILQERKGR